jgi:hypothetical protein
MTLRFFVLFLRCVKVFQITGLKGYVKVEITGTSL